MIAREYSEGVGKMRLSSAAYCMSFATDRVKYLDFTLAEIKIFGN